MHTTPRFSNRSGFTLIELLTVIAIIGILAAILIPVVGRVRESARSSVCTSNLRQIGMALFLYADDNGGQIPPANDGGPSGDNFSGGTQWTFALDDYLPRRLQGRTFRAHQIFTCPSANYGGRTGDELNSTYSYTGAALGSRTGGLPSTASVGRHLEDILDQTIVPLVIEGKALNNGTATQSNWNWGSIQSDLAASAPEETRVLDFRHNERMNILYVDGSVRSSAFLAFKEITQNTYRGINVP